jgi:hypothetical protein
MTATITIAIVAFLAAMIGAAIGVCARRGLDPDDYAADGVLVWMVVDQEMDLGDDGRAQHRERVDR